MGKNISIMGLFCRSEETTLNNYKFGGDGDHRTRYHQFSWTPHITTKPNKISLATDNLYTAVYTVIFTLILINK